MNKITAVPAALRDWAVTWPEYAPVDVTPDELQPAALAHHVPDWAEAAPTPDAVTNWPQRQANAIVPYQLDAHGWPQHPHGRTGKCGRNLPLWGENAAADAIVVAGRGEDRQVLLITRDDIGVSATPGGMRDPGETEEEALRRELHEETGLILTDHQLVILGRQVVRDWRESDRSWVASAFGLLRVPATMPATAGDDARDAAWWPFRDLAQLEAALTAAGHTLYAAHRPFLQHALRHLAL
ncbi:NUDIX domain-containing protein [Kitasatospora sp. NPDC094028]